MRAIDGGLETLTVVNMAIRMVCVLVQLSICAGWRLALTSRIDIGIILNVGKLLVAVIVLVVVVICHGTLQTRSPPSLESSHFL